MSDLDKLELEAALQRQKLALTLDALTNTVSPENVQTHAADLAKSYGGDLGDQALGAAKQNPAAFALVGAGLSLLLTGTGSSSKPPPPQTNPAAKPARAALLRAKLDSGLETLSPDARQRVIEARIAALAAQEKVEAEDGKTSKKSNSFLHDQPLVVGAIALGLGALIGAVLPSMRRKGALLSKQRDTVMARAQSALRDEIAKAEAAATPDKT